MNPYRIILADDHIMLRQGIKKIIEESEDIVVIAEASDGLELLAVLKKMTPEMIILDISMPNLRGIEVSREIKSFNPEIKVLILTMHKKIDYLYHSLSAGADGFLLKEDTDEELFTAIETIRRGRIYVSPSFSTELAEDMAKICRGDGSFPVERLTTREREVLKLVSEGKSSKEIADLLFISVRTAEHHRESIKRKLNLKKVADLVKYAILEGYTSETPR
jgi:DNA-binding NarL/FixJ family response regulator